jgi:hypothetical protein
MDNSFVGHWFESADHFTFSADDYSKFKFGDGRVASKFGKQLALKFLKSGQWAAFEGHPIAIVPSPHSNLPTASYFLAKSFANVINAVLAKRGHASSRWVKVTRQTSYLDDYGNLSAPERQTLIGNDRFTTNIDLLKDCKIIAIDDVRITGTHQLVLENMFQKYGLLQNVTFVYFAALSSALTNPAIENVLNYHYVKHLGHVLDIINGGAFKINTRVIKFILSQPVNDLEEFLIALPAPLTKRLYLSAIGNNYHMEPSFKHSIAHFNAILTTNLIRL